MKDLFDPFRVEGERGAANRGGPPPEGYRCFACRGRAMGRRAAGTKDVPLSTATQWKPLRGSDHLRV
jgi:hypothetical protein